MYMTKWVLRQYITFEDLWFTDAQESSKVITG